MCSFLIQSCCQERWSILIGKSVSHVWSCVKGAEGPVIGKPGTNTVGGKGSSPKGTEEYFHQKGEEGVLGISEH